MSSAPTPDEIARDARWLAQELDPAAGMVRLVAMDREAYRAASYLDDRLLQQSVDAIALEVERISEAQRFEAKLLNERIQKSALKKDQ